MKDGATVPIAQARPRLTEILDMVRRTPVTITKDGEPVAVVIDPKDYESLVATVETLSNPAAMRAIRSSQRGQGGDALEWVSQEDVERLIGA